MGSPEQAGNGHESDLQHPISKEDILNMLVAKEAAIQDAIEDRNNTILLAREHGISWANIGRFVYNVTRQAAWERFKYLEKTASQNLPTYDEKISAIGNTNVLRTLYLYRQTDQRRALANTTLRLITSSGAGSN